MKNDTVCRFCGQILMDGSECNCAGAYAQRKIEVQKASARKAVEDIFGEGSQDNGFDPIMEEDFHALILIADLAAEKKINSATLVFPPNVKAKITRGSGGKVKIERSEVRATKQEVEG